VDEHGIRLDLNNREKSRGCIKANTKATITNESEKISISYHLNASFKLLHVRFTLEEM
jgi:hypothetical protein